MKISVIIPVYNRLEHLRAGFISLIRQKKQPDELIITDDGSSQNILNYIADLIPSAKFKVKHIYQEDKGFRKTRALNNAVLNAEGEVLVFCDQDLIFGEEYIEIIYKNIRKGFFLMGRAYHITEDEKNIVLSKIENIKEFKEIIEILPKYYPSIIKKMLNEDKNRRILNYFKLAKRGIKLVGMSYALLKEDYMKVNGYDENYIGWGEEDDDFGNRLNVAGIKGKELITPNIQLHLWHYSDPTKTKSLNEEYYYKRKKEIFKNKDYFCQNGCISEQLRDDIRIEELN
ncbi:MAG: glycosyltransferase [Fusobacterium sp.]|uniref:glycosyltransferase n=1 Tax=Fusobacterium sp. TaxID=68766 RepID=UPI0026DC64DF|nr:glycosyltransferase [Fusobacterium sp.]MDO4691092.1 glycosyltransferase [Fusobacterium sp.]